MAYIDNKLLDDPSQVDEGDVYLDICASSLDLETRSGRTVGSQFNSGGLNDIIDTKLQGSDIPITVDTKERLDLCLQVIKSEEIIGNCKTVNDLNQSKDIVSNEGKRDFSGCLDSCLQTIKSEEDVVSEGNVNPCNNFNQSENVRNDRGDSKSDSGNVPVTIPNNSFATQDGESVIVDIDQVANTIKIEEQNSLSVSSLQESIVTSSTARWRSERKRKQTPVFGNLVGMSDVNFTWNEGESEKKEHDRVEGEDHVYKPCSEGTVVKKKRGKARKSKSSLPAQCSSNVNSEKVPSVTVNSLPNPLYSDLLDVRDEDIELSARESKKKGQNRVEKEDQQDEPFTKGSVVKKKRGKLMKNKSSSQPQYSSNVTSDRVYSLSTVKHNEQSTNTEEEVVKFSCQDCQKGFVSSFALKKHKLVCELLKSIIDSQIPPNHILNNSKTYCPVCHKYLKTHGCVKRHLTSEHPNLFHMRCRLCYKKVGNMNNAFDHMLSQHPSKFPDFNYKGFFCTLCGESFKQLYPLKKHVSINHGNLMQLTCALCQRTVGAVRDYFQHFQDFHTKSSTEKGSASDTRVTTIPSSASLKELKVSQSTSEMVCPQCNKTVENYKLFILHTLSHKIDDNMVQVRQDCVQTSDPVLSAEFDPSHNHSKASDQFPLSLATLPFSGSYYAIGKGSFKFFGYDLVSAFNRSLIAMTEMSTRLHHNLQRKDSTWLKRNDDLNGKLGNLLRLSGGLSDIGKCLLLVLEECKQLTGKDPLLDDNANDDVEENDNVIDDGLDDKGESEEENVVESRVSQTAEITDDAVVNNLSQNCSAVSKKSQNLNEDKSEILKETLGLGNATKYNKNSDAVSTGQTEDDNFHEVNPVNENQAKITAALDQKNENGKLKVGVSRKKQDKKKEHICKVCGKHMLNSSRLNRHQLIHMNVQFQCNVCTATFRSRWTWKQHCELHVKGGKFKCDFCDATVSTKKALHSHMEEHKTENYFSCDKCKHKARTSYDLATHQKIHQPVSCKKCDYQAKHIYDLQMHEKTHLSLKLKCPHCAYAYATNNQLKRHMKTHDISSKEKVFCCELCGATFNNHKKLSYHVLRHSNKTPFSCPHCDYKCSAKSSYQTHLLKHSGLRPYVCSVCGAAYHRSSYLKQHALTHSDVKQFECKTCGKSFKYKGSFQEHMMIHSGEKKFKCHLCNFACRRRKILDVHVTKHNSGGSDVEMSENER